MTILLVLGCLLLFMHPVVAFIVFIVIALIDIMLIGWLVLCGLRINGVTTVCLVMAVGVAVDYSAHIAHAFMANRGTRNERAVQAVEDMVSWRYRSDGARTNVCVRAL